MPIYKGAILSNPSTMSNGVQSVMVKIFNVDGHKIPADMQKVGNLYAAEGGFTAVGLAKANRVTFEANSVLAHDITAGDQVLKATDDRPELLIHRITGFKIASLAITQARQALDLTGTATAAAAKVKPVAAPAAPKASLMDRALSALGLTRV